MSRRECAFPRTVYCTIRLTMPGFRQIVFALAITTLVGAVAPLAGQTGNSASVSNAKDEAFANYERVVKGMIPPKATKSPDPEYPIFR